MSIHSFNKFLLMIYYLLGTVLSFKANIKKQALFPLPINAQIDVKNEWRLRLRPYHKVEANNPSHPGV